VGSIVVSISGGEGVVDVEPASGAFLFAAATGDVQSEQLRATTPMIVHQPVVRDAPAV